jgi:hypothetical protein
MFGLLPSSEEENEYADSLSASVGMVVQARGVEE